MSYLYGERERERETDGERLILRNWGLASLKSAGQACRLEILRRVDVVVQVQRQFGGRIPSSLGDLSFFFSPKAFSRVNEAYSHYGG